MAEVLPSTVCVVGLGRGERITPHLMAKEFSTKKTMARAHFSNYIKYCSAIQSQQNCTNTFTSVF